MCRLYGFRSVVLSGVHRSLVAAENALGKQSLKHPDGWGVAFYMERYPHLIRSEKQAIEDSLFKEVSAVVATRTLIAHVRQATAGKRSVLNCHPFQHGPWTFAHNGEIAGYAESEDVRHRSLDAVDPRFRKFILGQTDSEVCFHIFLSRLARQVDDIYHEGVPGGFALQALRETVDIVRDLEDDRAGGPTRLSFLLTNGSSILGYRHRRELFYSTHKSHCPERETCHAYEALRCEAPVRDGLIKHLIVTSERIATGPNVWHELEDGEFVWANHGMFFRRGFLAEETSPSHARRS